MNRQATVDRILDRRLSAIIRAHDGEVAAQAMQAAINGGFRMVEFTLTTPDALKLIETFSQNEDVLVGAGTVLTVEQARDAVSAGARFLVSPITDPVIIEEAHRLDAACIPGTLTPTEMVQAHRRGADFVKLFPAPPGPVAAYITALRGPLPELRIFPTAGVDADNVLDVLRAGAAGAGFVRALFDPKDLADRHYSAIERRAALILQRLHEYDNEPAQR